MLVLACLALHSSTTDAGEKVIFPVEVEAPLEDDLTAAASVHHGSDFSYRPTFINAGCHCPCDVPPPLPLPVPFHEEKVYAEQTTTSALYSSNNGHKTYGYQAAPYEPPAYGSASVTSPGYGSSYHADSYKPSYGSASTYYRPPTAGYSSTSYRYDFDDQ